MIVGHTPRIEVASGPGPSLLVGLARAAREPSSSGSSDLDAALAAVGDTAGESWLNLLGVALDAGAPYTEGRLIAALEALDALELRRHLLGRYAWSWCALAGADVIEAAASGDDAAARELLASPRYYAGQARASLSVLLALDPAESKQRVVRAVEAGAELTDERVREALASAASDAAGALAEYEPLMAIEHLATGYRYIPEPEAERVVLVPHLEPEPQLVLAQHRDARVIAYRARVEPSVEERLLALGRALSDARRVEILGLVARGCGNASELVARTGLSRSTVHHHLALLRESGLVALEGNARKYTFRARQNIVGDAAALIGDVIGAPQKHETRER